MRQLIIIVACFAFIACEEAPLFSGTYDGALNAPSSFSIFPGTDLALISNTNISLQESSGSILVYDMNAQMLLEDTRFFTTNFGAHPLIDEGRERILIPDLDKYLRFYSYSIPGQGGAAISFAQEVISPAISNTLTNAIELDDIPSDIKLIDTQNHGELYVVVSQLGTITVIDADTLTVMDLNEKDRYEGLRLTSALTIGQSKGFPAKGVNRLFHDPDSNLLFATSGSSNFVYIFDPEHLENEGVLSFLSISGTTTGIRAIAIDSNQQAYIAHAGLESLLVVDFSSIVDNGISFEVIEPSIIKMIPLLGVPNAIVFDQTEDAVFVGLQETNEVVKVDTSSWTVTDRLTLSEGIGPSTLYFDTIADEVFSLNAFSNSLTRIDAILLDEIEEIK